MSKYLEHLEEIRRSKMHYIHVHVLSIMTVYMQAYYFILTCHAHFADYRYRKDEIFKRLKVTTFAQLVS